MKDGLYCLNALNDSEIAEASALERLCNQKKRVFFKLDPQALAGSHDWSSHLLYYACDTLKGYMSLNCFDGEETECTAIVEDDEDILNQMIYGALNKSNENNQKRVLLIIDTNDPFSAEIAKSLGFQFSFAEYRMNFDGARFRYDNEDSVSIQEAARGNMEAIAYLDRHGFGSPIEAPDTKETGVIDISNTRIVRLNGEVIGKMKVEGVNGVVGIYGFVIDPKWRGQGLGRRTLNAVIRDILSAGCKKLYLEVAAENQIAMRLYESVGFNVEAKFDYYIHAL